MPADFGLCISAFARRATLIVASNDRQVAAQPQGALLTEEYREDRVRIFVNARGFVVQPPKIG